MSATTFRHEAYLYAGEEEFLEGARWFIEDGVAADEVMLIALNQAKIEMLREELGDHADVHYANIVDVGQNPTRIISIWRDFLRESMLHGRRIRGMGAPIWAGRTEDELLECQRHEQLLNVAFAGPPAWWLMCPYDTSALAPEVIEEAARSHPFVLQHGASATSDTYRGDEVFGELDRPLPPPVTLFEEFAFDVNTLNVVRDATERHARRVGLDPIRLAELVFAVNEVASNSVRFAGGGGLLVLWQERNEAVCEIRDSGHVADLLVGRARPDTAEEGRRGLWLVNELCDLVELRSSPTGTTVRLRMTV